MQITDVESFLLAVPVGQTIGDSMQQVTRLEFVGVRIFTDIGLVGTGYTITVGHGGAVILSVIDTLYKDDLVGRSPHDVKAIWQDLYSGKAHWIGRSGATTMAQSAIDIALWDLIAKAADKPLWQVLGAARPDNIPVYNTHAGWLNFSTEQLVDEGLQLLDQGYRTLKMKVGLPSLAEDCKRIEVLRKAIGDDIGLMVDANQKWDLLAAREACRRFEDMGLGWIEEPMNPDDIRGHSLLKKGTSAVIALGEHVYTTHAFQDYVERDAVDVIQVDVCRVGGVTPWMEIAALARSAGLRVCPHAGDLMQVHQHLVKTIPNNWLLEVIPIWERGPFRQQIRIEDGFCISPEAPGASTDFTEEAFEKYRVQ